ncbi:hypothetical protein NG726_02745 [Pseudomonas sp. MOB-449]|nr:hypothetical protein [Pseudomonas sp. MOB-449]
MTLIVAGYAGSTLFGRKRYDEIFFVGDTLLSQFNGVTERRDRLIEIYRKIRTVPVTVWTPHFDNEGYFSRYLEGFRSPCVIAFAGSALTFGHMLNGIQEHLGQLRYTFINQTYKIVKHCSNEAIKHNHAQTWAEDIVFEQHNVPKLTAELQMDVVSHVIRRALKDVSEPRLLDQRTFDSIRCELAIAMYCWEQRAPVLYHVEVVLTDEIPRTPTFTFRRLGEEETVVLGKPVHQQVRDLMQAVRYPAAPPAEPKRGDPKERGRAEMCAAKQLLRAQIKEDLQRQGNYIGGYLDCWEFEQAGADQWYELSLPEQKEPPVDE